jgi:hypothetical protein
VAVHFAQQVALNLPIAERDQEFISDYVTFCARMMKWKGPGGLQTISSAPGYLSYRLDGQIYFIPYNLVEMFPTDEQLKDIATLMRSIQLSSDSTCCFSGSTTFIGQVNSISDIDFCEYFPLSQNLFSEINKKAHVDNSIKLVRAKYGPSEKLYPFADSYIFDKTLWPPSTGDDTRSKLDFLSVGTQFKEIAVTNVVIVTDGDPSATELKRSFALQEIVISNDAIDKKPKRKLDDPIEFGRYLNWLQSEVKKYIKEAKSDSNKLHLSIKALKRSLSWFLVVGLGDEIREAIDTLSTTDMELIAEMYRLNEVDVMLEKLTPDQRGSFLPNLPKITQPQNYTAFLNESLALAEIFSQTINEYMNMKAYSMEKSA